MRIKGTKAGDHLTGTDEADYIYGNGGDDKLTGGGGNDYLDGGDGVDAMKGGEGDDRYIADPGEKISDTGGYDTVIVRVSNDVYAAPAGVDELQVSASGPVTLIGNELDNTIRVSRGDGGTTWIDGKDGDDTLFGERGKDTFEFTADSSTAAGYGNDYADGNGKQDLLILGHYGEVQADLGAGFSREANGGTVTFVDIENASTASFDDLLVGSSLANRLCAGGGDDTIIGGGGDDYLDGDLWLYEGHSRSGRDALEGDGGNDTLIGGNKGDYLNGGSGADHLDAGAGGDLLVWDAADFQVDGGSGGNDVLLVVSGDINLKRVSDTRVVGIEEIDLTGGGGQRLALTASDVLALSSETDKLKVTGDADDSIDIIGTFEDAGVSGGYHRYKVGDATLLVDPDITSVF